MDNGRMMTEEMLMDEAKGVLHNAYSPYSGIKVGAALLTSSGNIHTGVNVENASFGATICAERVALAKAVTEGESNFEAIAIASNTEEIVPCGICRQVFAEFNEDIKLILQAKNGEITVERLCEVYKDPFLNTFFDK